MHREHVKAFYGDAARGGALGTVAGCDAGRPPVRIREILRDIHPEVSARYFGCGLLAPEPLDGLAALDLGCGAGRDAFLLSKLVGPRGRVVGVDMTEAQLGVARGALAWQTERFGFDAPNVTFLQGDIEDLDALGLAPGSFDLIVSNCVVNLAADKGAVLRAARRLLKPGGEMHFADVYADRRLPEALRADPALWSECLSGALYRRDFLALARAAGFGSPRRLASRPFEATDPALAARLGAARFASETWRLFALDALDPEAEDYGQTAAYRGGLPDSADAFALDERWSFPTGETVAVDRATFRILAESRLAAAFDLDPGDGLHRGAFDAPEPAAAPDDAPRVIHHGADCACCA